jgi:energy-coupling factor transporter ATP-binding protein EcfA2
MLYLSRIQLKNVRCFENLDLRLNASGRSAVWTVFVGDNATGKSTLLRSIAMGLCDEASAAGLLKESDEGYIRRGCSEAKITLHLRDARKKSREARITTSVRRQTGRHGIFSDSVRQTTSPKGAEFPWDEIFASGYGAGRGVSGSGDISGYSTIDAVYNLFNYTEGLQNPELTIRRLSTSVPGREKHMVAALSKFTRTDRFRLTSTGILVDGPWGDGMPLRDLSDGYKSAFVWLTDLLGWALAYRPRLKTTKSIRGIVLIDEIEQHLHARWQRTAIDDLRRMFPHVQFIATTHSPLVASCVGQYSAQEDHDQLCVLEATERGPVVASSHEHMKGWRMDQVLASRAFKYQVQSDPEFESTFRVASALLAKVSRSSEEERMLKSIMDKIKDSMLSGISPVEREVEKRVTTLRREQIARLEQELFPDEQ